MLSHRFQPGGLNGLALGLRVALGGAFLWAGGVKIADPQGFAAIVGHYQLLPGPLVNPVAVLLPWIEVLCGVLLIAGLWVDGSLLIINALMIVFMAALVSTWVRGIDVDCGCFSVATTARGSDYLTDVARDGVLLAIGLWLALRRLRSNRLQETRVSPVSGETPMALGRRNK